MSYHAAHGMNGPTGGIELVKRSLLALSLLLTLLAASATAQEDTTADTTDTATEPTSTINYFFAACEDQAVIDLDGTMEANYDIYVQVFTELNATGTPLTNLIRVPVNNTYQVSQVLPYNNNTLALGQFGSAQISIALENDSSVTIFTDTVDDVVDGCIDPSFPSVDTVDAGVGGTTSTSGTGTTPLIDPETGLVVDGSLDEPIRSSGIFTPDGGVLNEVFGRPLEAVVQIGARPSQNSAIEGRTSDPGLIFAECDDFAERGALPGVLYDTDSLTVFWSWFATTPELVQDHLATAQYEVVLSSDYAFRQPFPFVQVSPITEREDGNFWVFYTADLGNGFRPGDYRVDYYVTWNQAISDGIDDFGPGTATPSITSSCTFAVELNPFGVEIPRNNPTFPLQSG